VEAEADKGSVDFLADGSGYLYTYGTGANTNYGNAIVRFKLDLGADKLGDYEKITATFTGISGDVGLAPADHPEYTKNLFILASNDEADFQGYHGSGDIKAAMINTIYYESNASAELYAGAANVPPVVGPDPFPFETPIVRLKNLTGEVWFAIYLHATDGSYSLTDITFVKRDAPEEFKPVTKIEFTGAAEWFVNVEYDLTGKGTVTPSDATNRTIVWSSEDVTITAGKFTATTEGTITLIATITDGTAEGEDYVETFEDAIEIVPAAAPDYFTNATGNFSGLTVSGQGDKTPDIDTTNCIIDMSVGGGSALFIIDGITGAAGKTIKISYVVWVISGSADITLKDGGWSSIKQPNGEGGCNWYPTLNATSAGGTLELPASWYNDPVTKISFQRNGDTKLFQIKITGIVIE